MDGYAFTDEERKYWFFQPIRRPPLPTVRRRDQLRSQIDAFLLSRLESTAGFKKGSGPVAGTARRVPRTTEPEPFLKPGFGFGPEAERQTLIRRLSFNLLGLPPVPAEVERFAADPAPDLSVLVEGIEGARREPVMPRP